ncbi:eva-1 homolog Bb isoform X2 [Festucalex cinctus]
MTTANPESFALYFMMGVCFGLLMALCLLVAGITCRSRRRIGRPAPSPERRQLKESSEEEEEEETAAAAAEEGESITEEEEEGSRKMTLVPMDERSTQSNGTLKSVDVFASVEELEKARRLEERERIVREIWRNGQPDILATGTGTIGRVHYH